MENASKALLIAGTVLVSILILSMAVFLYTSFKNQSKQYNETISAVEIEKFNSKFDVYIGRNNIKVQEIVTIVNLAKEYNGQVQIYLGNSEIKFIEKGEQEEFIKDNQSEMFSCVLNVSNENPNPIYSESGRIIGLKFIKNS